MSATRGKAESTAQAEVAVGTPPARRGEAAEAPRPRRLGLALLVIAAAQPMVVLDATIVNVAPPTRPASSPVPPELVKLLRAHAKRDGTTP